MYSMPQLIYQSFFFLTQSIDRFCELTSEKRKKTAHDNTLETHDGLLGRPIKANSSGDVSHLSRLKRCTRVPLVFAAHSE
jgi:hypothetical protein